MKKLSAVIGLLLVMPIWYYLFYQALVRVSASELMFFLFWVYVPFSLFVVACSKFFEGEK